MAAILPPRVKVRKDSAGTVFVRPQLNFISGTNITLTVADDSVNNEIDITIDASGGGTGLTMGMGQAIRAGYVNTAITALS